MTPAEGEKRLKELADLEEGWDGGSFCETVDGVHRVILSARIKGETITQAHEICRKMPCWPTDIMPITGDEASGGSFLELEWRGPLHEFGISVGPEGLGGWLLVINQADRARESRRYFESDNPPSILDLKRWVQVVMR